MTTSTTGATIHRLRPCAQPAETCGLAALSEAALARLIAQVADECRRRRRRDIFLAEAHDLALEIQDETALAGLAAAIDITHQLGGVA